MPTTNYLWNDINDTVVMEKDGAGNTTAVYQSDPVPFGRLRSMRRGGTTYNYHFDGRGNATHLTDQAGQTTDTYSYDAFGNRRLSTGSTENSYCFGGEHGYQYNPATDDYYVRARVYHPKCGRWRSKDPFEFADGMGPYLYVGNAPVVRMDPSGFFSVRSVAGGPFFNCKPRFGNPAGLWWALWISLTRREKRAIREAGGGVMFDYNTFSENLRPCEPCAAKCGGPLKSEGRLTTYMWFYKANGRPCRNDKPGRPLTGDDVYKSIINWSAVCKGWPGCNGCAYVSVSTELVLYTIKDKDWKSTMKSFFTMPKKGGGVCTKSHDLLDDLQPHAGDDGGRIAPSGTGKQLDKKTFSLSLEFDTCSAALMVQKGPTVTPKKPPAGPNRVGKYLYFDDEPCF